MTKNPSRARQLLMTAAIVAGAAGGAATIAGAASSASSSTTPAASSTAPADSSASSSSTAPVASPTSPAGTSDKGTPPSGPSKDVQPPTGAPKDGQPPAGSPDPATMTHGPGETLLTGSDLSSAVAAANTAVPGATVVRAETDNDASGYEVHMKKADGSYVTVNMTTGFSVTSIENGFGPVPAGAPSGTSAPSAK